MTGTILARIFENRHDCCEWLIIGENSKAQQGTLQELSQAAKDCAVTLLLPATEVLLIEIDLPVKTNSQLKKALPYAVEELLANEVENYHLVWSKQQNHKIAVAAIEHEKLASYLQHFHAANIKLEGVYSEALLLPFNDDMCSILIEQNRAVARFDRQRGGGIELDYLPLFIEKTIAENNLSANVQVWSTEPCADLPRWSTSVYVNCEQISSVLPLLQANLNKKIGLNLLAGQYSPQQHSGKHWKAWIPAAAITLLAVLIQYGVALKDYSDSKAQLAELEAENQQLFKQTFPELKRIVNIKTQAEQELIALRKKGVSGKDSDYLRLLYESGEILMQDPSLQLQTTDFVNGVLSIQLTGTDIAQIENFKQLMQKNNGVSVKIQSAETNDKGLSAHIDISGKS